MKSCHFYRIAQCSGKKIPWHYHHFPWLFHDFPWPLLFSMTFKACKMVFLNSMTFHDQGARCLVLPRRFFGQTRVKLTTWRYITFAVTAHVHERLIVLHLWTKFEVRRPSRVTDFWSRRLSAWWPWPLTFRPINGVTGHTRRALPSCQCGPHSPVTYTVCQKSRLSLFLQLRQMRTFLFDLGSGTGQTDRRTDRRQPSTLYAPTVCEGITDFSLFLHCGGTLQDNTPQASIR